MQTFLPPPFQLLGTDKKGFELWSLPLISASQRRRCCPPASKAPPGPRPSRSGRREVPCRLAASPTNEEDPAYLLQPRRVKVAPRAVCFFSPSRP